MMKFLIIISALALMGCGVKVQNQDPGSSGAVPESKGTINVLTYNLHHCNPPTAGAAIDVDTIAGVIRKVNPDIVALQEVDVKTKRSGGVDQAALLGEKTGMKSYFFKAIDHDGGEYGVAILSKLAVSEFRQYALPTVPESKGEPRILATVMVKLRDGSMILFACTHLDAQSNSQNRLLQIREITTILQKSKVPVIIAGDLNAATGSEVINIFDQSFKRSCEQCAFTIPVKNPNKTIDFIGYSPKSGFSVEKHEVINETYASDHLPVNAILRIKR
jgi:endonuclease/exonuclease/phosphatase family metal-dependent hydrolase